MEEDIKILEEMAEKYELHLVMESPFKEQAKRKIEAIKNVIHELKYNKIQFETQLREKLDLQANSIQKSKIKEMIEEYEKEYADISDRNSGCLTLYREKEIELEYKIEALKELLK